MIFPKQFDKKNWFWWWNDYGVIIEMIQTNFKSVPIYNSLVMFCVINGYRPGIISLYESIKLKIHFRVLLLKAVCKFYIITNHWLRNFLIDFLGTVIIYQLSASAKCLPFDWADFQVNYFYFWMKRSVVYPLVVSISVSSVCAYSKNTVNAWINSGIVWFR